MWPSSITMQKMVTAPGPEADPEFVLVFVWGYLRPTYQVFQKTPSVNDNQGIH